MTCCIYCRPLFHEGRSFWRGLKWWSNTKPSAPHPQCLVLVCKKWVDMLCSDGSSLSLRPHLLQTNKWIIGKLPITKRWTNMRQQAKYHVCAALRTTPTPTKTPNTTYWASTCPVKHVGTHWGDWKEGRRELEWLRGRKRSREQRESSYRLGMSPSPGAAALQRF